MLKKIRSVLVIQILSANKEKWWTVKEFFVEIDNLRDKYSDENDEDNLKFLDEFHELVMSIHKNYENA